MSTPFPPFSAVVLAGDRQGHNPVAKAAGVDCKVLAPVDSIPMILRVVETLERSVSVTDIVVCGPDRSTYEKSALFQALVKSSRIRWLEASTTPSTSAWNAMQSIPKDRAVLLTTGDHALLSPEMVDFFCQSSMESRCDVTAALCPTERVKDAFPETKRTAYGLKDGSFCSCNLFSFLTPGSRNAALYWKQVEEKRKNPLKVIKTFGLIAALKYLAGMLTLSEGMDRISRCIGCRACAVIMPYPESAVDVDTPADLEMVSAIATGRRKKQKPDHSP